jgi:SAM-dependent methyltransferase
MPERINHCQLCGSQDQVFRSYAEVRGWNYVTCKDCGLVFLDPQPTRDELRIYYDSMYKYDPRAYKDSLGRQALWLRYVEETLGTSGLLLEIGCSYGYFLKAARERGWTVRGVEPGRDASDFARRKLGLDVVKGTIADLDGDPAGFDAVVAWHVLEHDSNPREFMRITANLLKPGGVLGIRVPNLESTVSRLAGETWQWLSPPEHVCMYRKATLVRLLREFELDPFLCTSSKGNARNMWFEIVRARTKKLLSGALNNAGVARTTASFQPPPRYENRSWYRAVERSFEIASWPLDVMTRRKREQRGMEAELVVFARKPVKSTAVGNRSGISD